MKALKTLVIDKALKESANILMNGIISHELEKDGMWTYVTTSMLRSVGSPASIQISSMLGLISNAAVSLAAKFETIHLNIKVLVCKSILDFL